jgi:hypothetical protein
VSGGGRVDVMAKVKGSDLYVIAVNVLHAAAGNDQVVELEIPGLASASASATVYEEGRTLPIVGRKLTDSFSAAVPVHIYVIPNYVAPPSKLKVKR